MLRAAIVAAAAVASVDGHASMTRPVPRNAADANLTIFKDGSWPTSAGKAGRSGCSCTGEAGGCDAGLHRPQTNGQPCLWFNQGCSPGCKTCTGTNGHANKPLCDTFMEPTNTDPRTRTEHPTDAKSYHYTPWRSPGHAPVTDACGIAGGTPPQHEGPGVAVFTDIGYAKQGSLGSQVLKKGPAMETWKAGSSVEVAWGIRYNHGGGYQYRLCPANETLTEECFQRMPLEFVRDKQQLLWNNGSRLSIPGVWVDNGTNPIGSTWARNPIPRIDWGTGGPQHGAYGGNCDSPKGNRTAACVNFKPPCTEGEWENQGQMLPWHTIDGAAEPDDVEGYCSGDWTDGQIVDEVLIPKDLPKGDYVVGWRWDCEETTQIWTSCGDVTIV